MTQSYLAPSPNHSSPSSQSLPSGSGIRPARRFGLPRIAIALVASAIALSACASEPNRPQYPGRQTGSIQDNTAMGGAAREMRSTQSVLSSGNSLLGTIGSIGRNISRLGR